MNQIFWSDLAKTLAIFNRFNLSLKIASLWDEDFVEHYLRTSYCIWESQWKVFKCGKTLLVAEVS